MLVGVGGQLLNTLMAFVARLIFIQYLSAAYLGINGLFSDVLGMLNLAELGIGTAMIYSLYLPVAQKKEKSIARLMNLYCLMYRVVSSFVFIAGLCLMPFLHLFIKDGSEINHLYVIYLLYLLQSASSYLLSYKNSIYLANQKAYLKSAWDQIFHFIQLVVQVIILISTKNFILYLVIQLLTPLCSNVIISWKVDKEFPYLKEIKELPSKEECISIFKNIGALSLHKLATVVVKGTDNLIMSAFVGLSTVGVCSNYKMIVSNINLLLGKVVSAFSGSIGNLGATEEGEKIYDVYRILDFSMFLLYGYLAGGMVVLFNFFIRLYAGNRYLLSMTIVVLIVIEFYISGMRQVNLQFREALGLFWHDRYKAVVEALINLVVSLILVKKYGVAGIYAGTIISTLFTCFWVEPYILMRHGMKTYWKKKLVTYFIEYGKRIIAVGLSVVLSYAVYKYLPKENILWFLIDGIIYTFIYIGIILGFYVQTEEYRYLLNIIYKKIWKRY